eukprot:COSAG04_NODE_19545_length_413_cov_2.630573_2_plen_85_part_01
MVCDSLNVVAALRSLETIGYAFSLDGFNFTKSLNNPVVRREATPGVSAMAESHACKMLSRFDRVETILLKSASLFQTTNRPSSTC